MSNLTLEGSGGGGGGTPAGMESRVNLSTLNCPALFTELAGRTQYFHHEPEAL